MATTPAKKTPAKKTPAKKVAPRKAPRKSPRAKGSAASWLPVERHPDGRIGVTIDGEFIPLKTLLENPDSKLRFDFKHPSPGEVFPISAEEMQKYVKGGGLKLSFIAYCASLTCK